MVNQLCSNLSDAVGIAFILNIYIYSVLLFFKEKNIKYEKIKFKLLSHLTLFLLRFFKNKI